MYRYERDLFILKFSMNFNCNPKCQLMGKLQGYEGKLSDEDMTI